MREFEIFIFHLNINKKDRLEILKKYAGLPEIRHALYYIKYPLIKFIVPRTSFDSIPFKKNKNIKDRTILFNAIINKMPYFIESGYTQNISKYKIQRLYIETLENMHYKDAEFFVKIVRKKYKIKNITLKMLNKVYKPEYTGITLHDY